MKAGGKHWTLIALTCLWPCKLPAETIMVAYTSGTGFFISRDGYILTSNHVVSHCAEITVSGAVRQAQATLVAHDTEYDLALLKVYASPGDISYINSLKQPLSEGDPVVVYGYPGQAAQTGIAVTRAAQILSTKGLRGEERWLELSDVLEQGNSGGPLLDASGNVVGVVAAKAQSYLYNVSEQRAQDMRSFGLAISLPAVRQFLESNHIGYQQADSGLYLSTEQVADKAQRFVVNVRCRYEGPPDQNRFHFQKILVP